MFLPATSAIWRPLTFSLDFSEEMDAIFEAKHPVRASLRKVPIMEVTDNETGWTVPEVIQDDQATLRH